MAKRRGGYNKNTILQKGTGAIFGDPSFTYTHTINLNSFRAENDFPTIPSGALNVGFGFNWRFNRLEVG
ncbi:hypothetical protein ACFFF3_10675, partial [Mongoliitalea lutea]